MNKKQKRSGPKRNNRELAEKIAADLMTDGGSEPAVTGDSLRIYLKERWLAGWGKNSLVDRIEKHLNGEL